MSHARDFGQESGKPAVAEQVIYDYRLADLDQAQRQLCDYAVKLTLQPAQVREVDLEKLRHCGFDDDGLTIAAQVIGYFNYINRVAEALGADREDWMTISPAEWHSRRAKDYSGVAD